MHGRAAFTGKRRMCGGYSKSSLLIEYRVILTLVAVNHDDFISKYRTSNLSAEELAGSTVTG